jgi:hypothetical protein
MEEGDERAEVLGEQRDQLAKLMLLEDSSADILLRKETDDWNFVRRNEPSLAAQPERPPEACQLAVNRVGRYRVLAATILVLVDLSCRQIPR